MEDLVTSLQRATWADDLEGVRRLLDRGVSPNQPDIITGDSAIHRAARGGRIAIAQLLLQHGADINLRDAGGRTPVHIAVCRYEMDTLKFLLENGADPNAESDRGSTLLHLACTLYNKAEFARVLLAFGAKIDKTKTVSPGDKVPETPLHIAALNGNLDTIKVLVRKGANIDDHIFRHFIAKRFPPFPEVVFVKSLVSDGGILLLRHVSKLLAARMYVKDLDDDDIVLCKRTDIWPECEQEIARMEVDAVGHHSLGGVIYLYDVLVSSVDELAALFGRCPLRESLRCAGLKEKYPLYADIISAKIHNAEWKRALLDNCVEFFSGVLPGLPLLCAEHIRSYLSDIDMRRLLCACLPKVFYDY